MEILFAYNVFAFIFTAVALLVVWLVGFVTVGACVKHAAEETILDAAMASRLRRNFWMICGGLTVAILSWSYWCVHDNYAARAEALVSEKAQVDFVQIVKEASQRPFDQRCAFNGHKVPEDWIAADSFPCADFGTIRLWRNSQIVISRYNSLDSTNIFIGTPAGNDVKLLATLNPSSGRWGVHYWLTWLFPKDPSFDMATVGDEIKKSLH